MINTCTRCPGLRSSSYGHGSSCTGAASSFRPRTSPGRRDAAWYDPRLLPGRAVLSLCIGRTRGDASGRTSWLSATLSRSHAAPRSSVHPGTAVHVRHNIFSHTAPALGIPDTCTVSAVFLAFVSSPASKKDRWLQASVLIFFLLIIVYLTEACDIKCCFSDIQWHSPGISMCFRASSCSRYTWRIWSPRVSAMDAQSLKAR